MLLLLVTSAFAGGLSKAECKTFVSEVKGAYAGQAWALKDLPVNTGFTMYAAWISPIAEVGPSSVSVVAKGGIQTTVGSAQSVWFGVRPNDTLTLKEAECTDDGVVVAFVGSGASKGRDTKIKLVSATTFGEVQAGLATLVTGVDPVDASWPDSVKTAIHNRTVVNGMTKRQAYLVVGEPTGASTEEGGGKKIEIWKPRQDGGMRIGYGAAVETTGYPTELRFEDGLLVGVGTTAGGGVNLD